MGLRLFLVSRVSCQSVRVFSGGGGLIFFWRSMFSFLGGGYILKLAFCHDKVLPCILQTH